MTKGFVLARLIVLGLAGGVAACSDATGPVYFAGKWLGTTSELDLELALLQQADTVQGTLRFTLHPSGYRCMGTVHPTIVRGIRLDFIAAMPLTCNYGSALFAGALMGPTNKLAANVTISTTTSMLLTRQ